MIYKILPLLVFVLFSFKTNSFDVPHHTISSIKNFDNTPEINFKVVYHSLNTNSFRMPNEDSFTNALKGFYDWKEKGSIQKEILTIIDFSLSSSEKRLWVIDVKNNTIIHHSLVAHGRNSGEEYANNFSNKPESHKSSLGFYATGETYIGKHGYSLRLDGLENGVNNNARKRAIVIHGADYVSNKFILQNGRLGRSFGCPSLPKDLNKEIIDSIKNNSCLYIYYPSNS